MAYRVLRALDYTRNKEYSKSVAGLTIMTSDEIQQQEKGKRARMCEKYESRAR